METNMRDLTVKGQPATMIPTHAQVVARSQAKLPKQHNDAVLRKHLNILVTEKYSFKN